MCYNITKITKIQQNKKNKLKYNKKQNYQGIYKTMTLFILKQNF